MKRFVVRSIVMFRYNITQYRYDYITYNRFVRFIDGLCSNGLA